MKRFFILLIIFCLMLNASILAHPWKPDHYVVIDTDCGIDDFRTINLMLAAANVRVLAIITSNGVINSTEAYRKVKDLLNDNHHEGIMLGINSNSKQIAHNCKAAMDFSWGEKHEEDQINPILYSEVLDLVFKNSTEKITFINMGGLNTFVSYFNEYPDQIKNLQEILWTCSSNKLEESFNYLIDTLAFNSVKNNAYEISYINGASFGSYNSDLVNEIGKFNSKLAKSLNRSLSIPNNPYSKNMYDESVLFYLLNNQIFTIDSSLMGFEFELNADEDINSYYLDFLAHGTENQNQVLSDISLDTSDYLSDIQLMMESTIKKNGKEEWDACVLTSELHGHLGIYSIIGAKMGIRAREYFGAGVDELKITSYAGLNPPFSCLNDGLQVSTGATLGHGLISVNENTKLPKAEFYYMGRVISISLKGEYQRKIESEIKDLRMIYSLDSNMYWDLLRKLALQYWKNWNRHDIFDIELK